MNILNNGDLSENLFIVKNGFISYIYFISVRRQTREMQKHFIEQGKVVDYWVWSRGLSVRARANTDYKHDFRGVSPFIVQSEQLDGGVFYINKEFGFNTAEEVRAFAQKILDCAGPPLMGLDTLESEKVFPEPQTLEEWILANWPPETLKLMKTSEWMVADPTEHGKMIRAMLDKSNPALGVRDRTNIARFLRNVRIHSKNKND
jgi:hypothetical protein